MLLLLEQLLLVVLLLLMLLRKSILFLLGPHARLSSFSAVIRNHELLPLG